MNTSDRGDFLKLLAGRPHTVSLSGHTHTTEHHYFSVESGFCLSAPPKQGWWRAVTHRSEPRQAHDGQARPEQNERE